MPLRTKPSGAHDRAAAKPPPCPPPLRGGGNRFRPPLVLLFLLWVWPARAQDIAERLELCATCHGEAGIPQEKDTPIISGQSYYYLYVQLKDYKAGRRTNEIMNPIAAEMSKEEMQALAKHFSELPWPKIPYEASGEEIARAERAEVAGACTECHLGSYTGNNSDTPRVAGQQQPYLQRTMLEFKNKVRLNAPAKGTLFATFDDADLIALSQYLAGK
jgi:cytochrome c553